MATDDRYAENCSSGPATSPVAELTVALGQSEEARRNAEERLRLLDEGIQDFAVIQLDTDGRVASWNPGAQSILGYRAQEILGEPIARFFTPEDIHNGKPAEELRVATEQGQATDDNWQVRKDGQRFWASGLTRALRNADGTVRGFLKVFRDLTERRQAEEAQRESEHRLRVALAAARMGIWRWDVRADHQMLDDNLYRLLGRGRNEFIYSLADFLGVIHPDDRAAVESAFLKCVRERTHLNLEFRVVWPDGSIHWLKDEGDLFYDARGEPQYLTGACAEVTHLKELEEALRQQAEELVEEHRRKDEFLAMLAHELRNPLAPIRTMVEVIRLESGLDPRRDAQLEVIARQIRHLTRLVDDLLDVSRITRGTVELRKQPLDVAQAVGSIVEAVRPLMDARRHELMVQFPARPLWVVADPTRLEQVLVNLLTNAARYTEPGGRVWLSAEREEGLAVFRVRDTGKGIAPENLRKIFDIFVQLAPPIDRGQGGMGLGLTLARRLVDMHGGTIEAHSAGPGRGSEFVVRLPAFASDPPPRCPTTAVEPVQRRPVRILVVDDNMDAAQTLGLLLQCLGHEVRLAHNGAEALAAALEYRPEAVLLDIGLPGMDGYEVARRWRAQAGGEHTLLVALTGYGQEQDRLQSQQAGFNHHLVKPVEVAELQEVLATAPVRP